MHIYQALATRVEQRRTAGYPHPDYSTAPEILEWSANPDDPGLRLRPPQVNLCLVAGVHELDAPSNPTTVAVKVTDMLGEEVLVTETA